MAQLDALRAIAVAGVLLQHYWPPTYAVAETGAMGVHLFFVLSGFLITGILLKARAAVDAGRTTAGFSLRRDSICAGSSGSFRCITRCCWSPGSPMSPAPVA
jgi:hypothetical protein